MGRVHGTSLVMVAKTLAVVAALLIGSAIIFVITSHEENDPIPSPAGAPRSTELDYTGATQMNTKTSPGKLQIGSKLSSACPDGDADCHKLKPGSYCKYYKAVGVCHGTDKPCNCTRKEKAAKKEA